MFIIGDIMNSENKEIIKEPIEKQEKNPAPKKKKMKIFSVRTAIILILLVLLGIFLYFENTTLSSSHYIYESELVSADFDGFKIVQVSDFHQREYGKDNKKLLNLVKSENPDIIVITGDMVSCTDKNFDIAVEFADKLADIAPTYYSSGNHEMWGQYFPFMDALKESDVKILENEKEVIKRGKSQINLYGLSYEVFCYPNGVSKELQSLIKTSDEMNILLAHRPDLLSDYSSYDVDLVFSGHAHGGQIRGIFKNGIYAPDQGLFPKLTAGVHTEKETTMIISRGLGGSHFVPRVFNKPELVTVTLKSKN